MKSPLLLATLLSLLVSTASAQIDCVEMAWELPEPPPEALRIDYTAVYAINGRGVVQAYWHGEVDSGELCLPEDDPGPWFFWISAWYLYGTPYRHVLEHSEFRLLTRGTEVGPVRFEFAPLE